jgi:hypothetical protein
MHRTLLKNGTILDGVGSRAGKPRGVLHVFINGKHALKDGAFQAGVRAGKVLRT